MNDWYVATCANPLRVWRTDAIVAVCVGAVALFFSFGSTGPISSETETLVFGITLLSSIAVSLRRVAPLSALLLTSVLAAVVQAMSWLFVPMAEIGVLMSVYAVAAFAPRKYTRLAFAPMVAAVALVLLQAVSSALWVGRPSPLTDLFVQEIEVMIIGLGLIVVSFVASWALGLNRRNQLAEVFSARERAELLERDQERLTQLALSDERARISREMHDIIAHSLASIVTLAEGGRLASSNKPELAADLFGKISNAGRDALGDIKLLLSRVDAGQDDAPMKGIDDLREIVESAQLAGVPITLEQLGTPRTLPAGLSLAVFRVGQECLTNMFKHAPGARGEIRLEWSDDELTLRAVNERAAAELLAPSDHRGIAGMRERTELFHGTFAVHERDTEFEVVATWPLADSVR